MHRSKIVIDPLEPIRQCDAETEGLFRAQHPGAQLGIHRGMYITLGRSEEHTSELQSLMRISYAVMCLKKKKDEKNHQRQYCTSLSDRRIVREQKYEPTYKDNY